MLTYPTGSTARRARKHGHRGGEDVSSSAISSEGTVDANGCVKLEEKMGTKIAKASKEIGVRNNRFAALAYLSPEATEQIVTARKSLRALRQPHTLNDKTLDSSIPTKPKRKAALRRSLGNEKPNSLLAPQNSITNFPCSRVAIADVEFEPVANSSSSIQSTAGQARRAPKCTSSAPVVNGELLVPDEASVSSQPLSDIPVQEIEARPAPLTSAVAQPCSNEAPSTSKRSVYRVVRITKRKVSLGAERGILICTGKNPKRVMAEDAQSNPKKIDETAVDGAEAETNSESDWEGQDAAFWSQAR